MKGTHTPDEKEEPVLIQNPEVEILLPVHNEGDSIESVIREILCGDLAQGRHAVHYLRGRERG
jgi:hypothetical protein